METVAYIARLETPVVLGAIGAVLILKMLTGKNALAGLLQDQVSGAVSPTRIQMLVGVV